MKSILNTLIIEDEAPAQFILQELIREFCPELNIVGTCNSISKAIPYFSEFEIDLIFLDIHLGSESGFQLFDSILPSNTLVVFITAHAEYALKAFEVEAIDYLLKPFDIEMLQRAVSRVMHRKALQNTKALHASMKQNEDIFLQITESGKIHKIPIENLHYLKAERVYTQLHLTDEKYILVSKPLNYFEAQLKEYKQFLRVHRSYLINTKYLKLFSRKHQMIELLNTTMIPVSRDKKSDVLHFLKE